MSNKNIEYENGLQIAHIQPTSDPFHDSWMVCSNCWYPLFEKGCIADTIPNICPKCLCILKTDRLHIS